jgi:hypothetical protein
MKSKLHPALLAASLYLPLSGGGAFADVIIISPPTITIPPLDVGGCSSVGPGNFCAFTVFLPLPDGTGVIVSITMYQW